MENESDNFTESSLRQFIATPPDHVPAHAPEEPTPDTDVARSASTKRGRRVAEVLSQSSQRDQHQQAPSADIVDAAVRKQLAELVQRLMHEQRYEELRTRLQAHQKFLNDILSLLDREGG